MQEAYMKVDYERQSFSVHQVTFPAPRDQKLIAIPSKDPEYQPLRNKTTRFSTASTAGIIVGSILFLVAVIVASLFYYRRRERARGASRKPVEEQITSENVGEKRELSGDAAIQQLMSFDVLELESAKQRNSHRAELEQRPQELAG
jgi:hypothetical protein